VQPGKGREETKPIRCAIYTRKSTEEGLDQEFNSLDAQRECAEAYIQSQRHERWVAIPHHYDDGGFTGANIERPALQKLLADVAARKVDSVIVYKVDRLSRSLLDFARIMEVLDKQGVSFVSVTQQLNTNSPMGRLTLNVLLSFAQFEREIISERTRDKKSAARRKGMWMGGYPVLGYDADANTRRLVENPTEAEQVRGIFTLFLQKRSAVATLDEIHRRGWKLKSWRTRSGKEHLGQSFDRPALVRLLTNVLYVGEVNHKGTVYPGEHSAIVDRKVFDRANRLLRGSSRSKAARERSQHEAAFRGLIYCAVCGSSMVYGFTTNHGRKYPYYICLTAQKRGAKACPGQVITSDRIEKSVILALCQRTDSDSTGELHPFSLGWAHWTAVSAQERKRIVAGAIERIGYDHRIEQAQIRLREETGEVDRDVKIRIRKSPFGRRQANTDRIGEVHEGVDEPQDETTASAEDRLPRITRLMALAIRFERLLREGVARDYADLARLGGVTRARITQIMNMRNLATSIQEEILFLPAGRTPINERALRQLADDLDWRRQLQAFAKLRSGCTHS
jgi:site-specific DNA recombinase